MLRLTTFGGIALTQDGGAVVGAASGRRRLALLALLAASGTRGVDREQLFSLLWPESATEQARHSLHQTMFAMRRSLGADELFRGTNVLHLNPACLSSDVVEFEGALSAGHLERAVAIYAGPFADGIALDEAPDAEKRLVSLRAHFATLHEQALEQLAGASAARGDRAGRVRWARQRADANPLGSAAATELIAAYVDSGRHVDALQFALVHETLVRQELDSPPDVEVMRWIQRLRASRAGAPSPAAGSSDRTNSGAADAAAPFAIAPAAVQADRRVARLTRAVSGRYQIGQQLETGRMIATYAATALGQAARTRVEIHVVQPRIAAAASAEVFIRAMGRVAGLTDARILASFDAGADDDVLFYVTAQRDGASLQAYLEQRGQLPVVEAVEIAREIAGALAHAHAHGVRHGDLRPKHVRLPAGSPVVGAFGVVDGLVLDSDSQQHSTIVALGSPTYMSPEQLTGDRRADVRSDVYALGCMLYEMLAGEPPFGRGPRSAALGRKLTQPAGSLRAQRESVSEELERITLTCLARVAADRYASGDEVAEALGAVAGRA